MSFWLSCISRRSGCQELFWSRKMTPSGQEIGPSTMPFRPSFDRQFPANPRSVPDTMPRQCVSFSTHFFLDSVFPVPLFDGLPDSPTRLEAQDERKSQTEHGAGCRFFMCSMAHALPSGPGGNTVRPGESADGMGFASCRTAVTDRVPQLREEDWA